MRFFLIFNEAGETVGCETTMSAVMAECRSYGEGHYRVMAMNVPVNADTVRRLLCDQGGYATDIDSEHAFISVQLDQHTGERKVQRIKKET